MERGEGGLESPPSRDVSGSGIGRENRRGALWTVSCCRCSRSLEETAEVGTGRPEGIIQVKAALLSTRETWAEKGRDGEDAQLVGHNRATQYNDMIGIWTQQQR